MVTRFYQYVLLWVTGMSFIIGMISIGALTALAMVAHSDLETGPRELQKFDTLESLQKHAAILQLVKQSDSQGLRVFVHALDDDEPFVRFTAIWALAKRASELAELPTVTEALFRKLHDEDFWVQSQAMTTLTLLTELSPQRSQNHQRVLAELLNLTKSRNPLIRATAFKGVTILGQKNVEASKALADAYQDRTWVVRRSSSLRQLAIARQALKDEDPYIRLLAILNLLRSGSQDESQILWDLIERIRDPHGEVASEAVYALNRLNATIAISPLMELLEFGQKKVAGVERALQKLSGKSIVELRQERSWRSENKTVQAAPVRMKDKALVLQLLNKLKKSHWLDRISALLELTWVEDPAVFVAINEGFEDQDPRVRYATSELLKVRLNSVGIQEHFRLYVDNIITLLQDPNPHVQKSIITLIDFMHMFGPPNYSFEGQRDFIVNELLQKKIQSGDRFVRHAAGEALQRLTNITATE